MRSTSITNGLLIALALTVAVATALPARTADSTWLSTGRAASTEQIVVRLALRQRNLVQLERRFWAVSDPNSAAYGDFMSVETAQ